MRGLSHVNTGNRRSDRHGAAVSRNESDKSSAEERGSWREVSEDGRCSTLSGGGGCGGKLADWEVEVEGGIEPSAAVVPTSEELGPVSTLPLAATAAVGALL